MHPCFTSTLTQLLLGKWYLIYSNVFFFSVQVVSKKKRKSDKLIIDINKGRIWKIQVLSDPLPWYYGGVNTD